MEVEDALQHPSKFAIHIDDAVVQVQRRSVTPRAVRLLAPCSEEPGVGEVEGDDTGVEKASVVELVGSWGVCGGGHDGSRWHGAGVK